MSEDAEAPIMQAIMNSAKIKPCGGGSVLDSSAGVQLKTKANIEPSKAETTMHITPMRQFEHSELTPRVSELSDVSLDPEPWFSFHSAIIGKTQMRRQRMERSKGPV